MTRTARRGPWLPDEDQALLQLVRSQGPNNWVRISQQIQHRSPKQCRERYHQNLKPFLKHDPITAEEGQLIEQMVAEMGKRWAEIARRLGNRSDNAVKNWWNGSMNRRRRNPTQTSSTFKSSSSTMHSDTTDTSRRHDSLHPRTCYEPWSTAADLRGYRRNSVQLPSPTRTHDSLTHEASPLPHFENRSYHDASNPTTRSSASAQSAGRPHPRIPPLRPVECTGIQTYRSYHSFDRPLVSPALSDASQPTSYYPAPSLISDTQSACSISPRTIVSPRPSLPAPIDLDRSWCRIPKAPLVTESNERSNIRQSDHSTWQTCTPSFKNSNSKDSRMHVSNLLG